MRVANKDIQSERDYKSLAKESLSTIQILEIRDNKVLIRVPANGNKKTASMCWVDIDRLMTAAIRVENGDTLTQIAKGFGINRTSLAEDLNKKLVYVKDIYLLNESAAKKIALISNLNSYKAICGLCNSVIESLEKNKQNNTNKINDESAISFYFEKGSMQKAAAKAGMHVDNYRISIKRSVHYTKVKEDVFTRKTGDISRVKFVAELFKRGQTLSDIEKILKQNYLNSKKESIKPVKRQTIRDDLEIRLPELYIIYDKNPYVREKFSKCGIKTHDELEKLFYEVMKEFEKRENENGLLKRKAQVKKSKTFKMTEFIKNKYKTDGEIVSIGQLAKEFKVSKHTPSRYLKGRLFYWDRQLYNEITEIWERGNIKINSYENDIAVENN